MSRIRGFIAVVALAASAALPAVAAAQNFGIIAGYSYGSIPNSGGVFPGTLQAHSGLAAGLRLTTSGPVGFGIEGLYAERGFTSTIAGNSRKLRYIDVPAYLRVALPNPTITPFGYIGPQLSFEINCDAGGGNCPSGRDKTTYAGIAGAGVKLPMLANISIEGRYVYGLNDLNMGTVTTRANYRARSFMILAGIGF
jgi:opacity protein-like surface antigen